MFASNYDPEMDVLRWFPYGGALDGTAFVSALGGVITKREMKDALKNMLDGAVDETGSLYWWPKAENMRRMIARCSQGQGSWIVQYMKQWLGIEFHAGEHLLLIKPKGMLDSYQWKDARLGDCIFDISYRETEEKSTLIVKNKSQDAFRVVFGCRPYGAGAQGDIKDTEGMAEPDQELILEAYNGKSEEEIVSIPEVEAGYLADDTGIVFNHFGFEQPFMEWMTEQRNVFLLRFLLINGGTERLENVTLKITFPDFMKLQEKRLRLWDKAENTVSNEITSGVFDLPVNERRVIPFWAELEPVMDASCVWFDKHPFLFDTDRKNGTLLICSEQDKTCGTITAVLSYDKAGETRKKEMQIPVETKKRTELMAYAKTFLGALS